MAAMVPPSAAPAQQTFPPAQSEPFEHSFETPVHEPTATQEAEGGSSTVQHVWPDGHELEPPSPPPPTAENRPQVAVMASGFPPSAGGFPPSAGGVVLASPPGVTVPEGGLDDELHAAANPRTRNAPKENRKGTMVSPGDWTVPTYSVDRIS